MHKFIVCTDRKWYVDREKHKTESVNCNLQSENFSFQFLIRPICTPSLSDDVITLLCIVSVLRQKSHAFSDSKLNFFAAS